MSFMTDMFIMTGKGTPEDSVDKYKRDNRGKDLDKEWTYQEVWDELFNSGNVLPQPLTEAHRVVVVDADDVAYRIAAACDKRSVVATIRGEKLEFDNKTKLKQFCEDVYFDFDTLKYENKVVSEPVSHCLATLKKTVRNIYKELNATHVIFFLGGSGNFRLDLPLPTQYKAARKDLHRPLYLKACREFLNKHYDTFIITGLEADDLTQSSAEFIINNTRAWCCGYNVDKDYRTALNKNRYYNPISRETVELSGGIGGLELKNNKVVGEGLHFLMYQCFSGDPSDNFSPKQFFNKRFGDKSYFNFFKDYDNEKELLEAWVGKWKELLPESIEYTDWRGEKQTHTWLTLANLYMRCPMMLMHPNDKTTFSSLLEQYEVDFK